MFGINAIAFAFLSTPSGWRATRRTAGCGSVCGISIHALRVEGDLSTGLPQKQKSNFYPRPPGGGRRLDYQTSALKQAISIHALRVEGDIADNSIVTRGRISIHALRVEGDNFVDFAEPIRKDFYPRPPGGGRHARVY